MKIQIGAGKRPIIGFMNYDIDDSHPHVHFASADALPCANNSVDLIFSNATFEHINPSEYEFVFKEWHRVLSPGGAMVHMGIPYFDHLIYLYWEQNKISREALKKWLLGEIYLDSNIGDFHKNLFNKEDLKHIFSMHGFGNVMVYDYCYPGEELAVNLVVVYGNITLESINGIENYIDLSSL